MAYSRFVDEDQYTLGRLIDDLEKILTAEGCVVEFDFGGTPRDLHSWRGSYEELAIGWSHKDYYEGGQTERNIKYKDFLAMLEEAVGKKYQGWKGGWYRMSKDTPVWVSKDGMGTHCGICKVVSWAPDTATHLVILETKYFGY